MKLHASLVQRQHWFNTQLNPNSNAYIIPVAFYLEGDLHIENLKDAISNIVNSNDCFKTKFEYHENELYQQVENECPLEFKYVKAQSKYSGEDDYTFKKCCQEILKPFELSQLPLVRFTLIEYLEKEFVLITAMHHAISDLETFKIFFSDLSNIYNDKTYSKLINKKKSYQEFSRDHAEWMESQIFKKMQQFWVDEIKNSSHYLSLPLDTKRPKFQTFSGNSLLVNITGELSTGIKKLGEKLQVNVFIILASAYYSLLQIYSKQKNITVGIPFTNRRDEELQFTLGNFANILPINIEINENDTFEDITRKLRQKLLLGHRNQEFPVELMIQSSQIKRDASYNALYQHGITFEPSISCHLNGLQSKRIQISKGSSQLDIYGFFRFDEQGNIFGYFEYNSDIFKLSTIQNFTTNFEIILQSIINNSNLSVVTIASHLKNIPNVSSESISIPQIDLKKMILSGTFTFDPIIPVLEYWIKFWDWQIEIAPTEYNQLFQNLLLNDSPFFENKNGYNICCIRFDDWISGSREKNIQVSQDAIQGLVDTTEQCITAIENAIKNSNVPFIIVLFPSIPDFENNEFFKEKRNFCKAKFYERLGQSSRAYLLDFEQINFWYNISNYYQKETDINAHIPFTPSCFTAYASGIMRLIRAKEQLPYKVIVADCDGTLWQGILGEDGFNGIVISEPYQKFQKFLLTLRANGMVLCLCSKNNESDVLDVLANHPDMIIRPEHIAFHRINWKSKSENIFEISKALNLGLDSFIFIDDSPMECGEMQVIHPEIFTIQIPPNIDTFTQSLNHFWIFDSFKQTSEDLKRAEQYQQEGKRVQAQQQFSTYSDFLNHLKLQITISEANETHANRISQLSLRTNQFNLTTKRMSEEDIKAILQKLDYKIWIIHVADRFGDYGLVGVIIAQIRNDIFDIHSFMLSCRSLGRGVEHKIVSYIGNEATKMNCPYILFCYKKTTKNEPILKFLLSQFTTYKQEVQQDLIFKVPSQFATSISFNPEIATAEIKNSNEIDFKKNEIIQVSPISIKLQEKIKQIASDLNSTQAIENLMEQQAFAVNAELNFVNTSNETTTKTEQILSSIWKEVLHLTSININDNFFDLGGRSILLPQIVFRLTNEFKYKIELIDLFQYTTIKSLAAFLDQKSKQTVNTSDISQRATLQKNSIADRRRRLSLQGDKNVN